MKTILTAAMGLILSATAAMGAALKADIVRTRYGVPHVTARDYAGLGYGSGYVFAEDNVCLLADQFVTLDGERSKYFGADGTTTVAFNEVKNIDSDAFFKVMLDVPGLRAAARSASTEYHEMLRGYAAGYNRYLRTRGPAGLPAACRNAAWVRPITVDDLLKLNEEKMIQASAGGWLAAVVAAAPPSNTARAAPPPALPGALREADIGFGSNGWAFGRKVTGGAGVLLGNPHFPWLTTNRFYQIHLTIPGQIDVMGAALSGQPGVSIGFNHDVAWTHTVSTDRHFTFFELALDPKDPTAYLVDGERVRMEPRTVTIAVKDGAPVQRTLYLTRYGPILVQPKLGLTWTAAHAYALKDANRLNTRSGDTWLDINRARSVEDIRKALDARSGIPWVNTIAADRTGKVLYADVTATPDLSADKLKACAAKSANVNALPFLRLYVLDGSKAACDWTVDAASVKPGLMPPASMPQTIRDDFVANSNDSFWLANDTARLGGFSPIVGGTNEPQNLRTRAGLIEIHDQLAAGATPAITPKIVEGMIFADRNYAAEMALDDVLAICAAHPEGAAAGKPVRLSEACAALSGWDRRMNVDSRGAALFVEFWAEVSRNPSLYAVPFDAADPVHTPRGLKRDPASAAKVMDALAKAVSKLQGEGVALDAPWGAVHFAVRGDQHIPLHGGPGLDGVLDAQQATWTPEVHGYVPFHGSSYMQIVTFDAKGPVAEGVLSYSQSTDPASPHYADQTLLYSEKRWNPLPFTPAEIKAAEISSEHIAE